MTSPSSHFLSTIWGDGPGFGEIRVIGSSGRVHQRFYALPAYIDGSVEEEAATRDVYFGVLPRTRRSGDADSCVSTTSVLWVDIDAKSFPTKADAFATIHRMIATPQIIVDSGHGYHAYWLLREPIVFSDAQARMKALELELGADHCSDAPRILRVPGTLNHKDDPPTPVRLIRYEPAYRYRASDFLEYTRRRAREPQARTRVERGDLPDWLIDSINHGAPKGQRSEAAFRVALWMTRYGYSPLEIRQVFESTPRGIGAKLAEKGERWLGYVLTAAGNAA